MYKYLQQTVLFVFCEVIIFDEMVLTTGEWAGLIITLLRHYK